MDLTNTIHTIIGVVLNFIMNVVCALISPLFKAIQLTFPDLSIYIHYAFDFLNMVITYVPFFLNVCCIPREALVFLFDYYLIKWTWFLVMRAYVAVFRIIGYFTGNYGMVSRED